MNKEIIQWDYKSFDMYVPIHERSYKPVLGLLWASTEFDKWWRLEKIDETGDYWVKILGPTYVNFGLMDALSLKEIERRKLRERLEKVCSLWTVDDLYNDTKINKSTWYNFLKGSKSLSPKNMESIEKFITRREKMGVGNYSVLKYQSIISS